MFSREMLGFLLGCMVMLGPLYAATYGARHASPETVKESGATPPGQTTPPDQKPGDKQIGVSH
jgi:hypothetical protein